MTKRIASVTSRGASKKMVRAMVRGQSSVTADEIEYLIANSDPSIQPHLRRAHDDAENVRQIAAVTQSIRAIEAQHGVNVVRDVPRLAAYLLDRDNLNGHTWENGLVQHLRFPSRAEGSVKTRDFLFVVSDDESIEADSKLMSSENGHWTVSHDCLGHLLVLGYVNRRKRRAGLGLLHARLDHLSTPAKNDDGTWRFRYGQPIGTNGDGKFGTTKFGEERIVWLAPIADLPEPHSTFATTSGMLVSRPEFSVLPKERMPGRELLAFAGEEFGRDAIFEAALVSGMLGGLG